MVRRGSLRMLLVAPLMLLAAAPGVSAQGITPISPEVRNESCTEDAFHSSPHASFRQQPRVSAKTFTMFADDYLVRSSNSESCDLTGHGRTVRYSLYQDNNQGRLRRNSNYVYLARNTNAEVQAFVTFRVFKPYSCLPDTKTKSGKVRKRSRRFHVVTEEFTNYGKPGYRRLSYSIDAIIRRFRAC